MSRFLFAAACGAVVFSAAFIAGTHYLIPSACRPCTTPICPLIACVIDFSSHASLAFEVGLAGAAIAFMAIRRPSK